eukprot:13054437-Ditylum_brightwellii.AAC.1
MHLTNQQELAPHGQPVNLHHHEQQMPYHKHLQVQLHTEDGNRMGDACFAKDGVANIIALHKAKDRWHVTYDSKVGNMFKVHKLEHSVIFQQSKAGLYYHDVLGYSLEDVEEECMFVNTVTENRQLFTDRQYRKAMTVQRI